MNFTSDLIEAVSTIHQVCHTKHRQDMYIREQ
jgi:hypothetical protein